MKRLALLALVACSAPPKRPIANEAPLLEAHPAPLVKRGGLLGLTTIGLPAISLDGKRVVIGFRDDDRERGLPNLTLVVKDRKNRELARHVVVSLAEADTMLDDAEGKNPQLDVRVSIANAWLDDLHRAHRLVRMLPSVPVRQIPPCGEDAEVFIDRKRKLGVCDVQTVISW